MIEWQQPGTHLVNPQVYAAGSEDMDTLTFNSPLLLRHLTFSEAKKAPISEINLSVVLEELDMDMERVSPFGYMCSRWHDTDKFTRHASLPTVYRTLYPPRM